MSLNKVTLIGRLGQDPKTKIVGTGVKVASFSIATSEKFTDKQGNKQERTTWHNCTVWGKLSDIVESYVKKGTLLYVEGKIEPREYENKDGVKVQTYDIRVFSLQMLGDRPTANTANNNQQQNNVTEDNLPF